MLFAGNGGSFADAQHLAAELVGRYRRDRRPLSAIALTPDACSLSAIANDFGWAEGLARILERLHHQVPGAPLLIAEYGIGTDDDEVRAEYLREGLRITQEPQALRHFTVKFEEV